MRFSVHRTWTYPIKIFSTLPTLIQSESGDLRFPPLLQHPEYILPQLARLAEMVRQAHVLHPGCLVTGQMLERGDDVLEPEGFADGLGAAGFEHDVDDVDVEVVVCWLVYPHQPQALIQYPHNRRCKDIRR